MKVLRKKTIALLIIVTMLTAFLPNLVINATIEPEIVITNTADETATSSVLNANGSVKLNFALKNGLAEKDLLVVVVSYDKTKLKLSGKKDVGEPAGDMGTYMGNSDLSAGTYQYMVYSEKFGNYDTSDDPDSLANLNTEGTIGQLTFTVLSGFAGTTDITISSFRYEDYTGKNEQVINTNAKYTIVVPNPISDLTLSDESVNLDLSSSSTKQLTAVVTPTDTTDTSTVNWTSSNSSVAEVSNTGLVTAKGIGNATITATVTSSDTTKGNNGVISKTCNVEVKKSIVGFNISADKTTLNMNNNEKATITASKLPSDSPDTLPTVSYTSDKTSVATVDTNGVVTPVAPGTATITASCGSLPSKTIEITVVAPIDTLNLNCEGASEVTLTTASKTISAVVSASGYSSADKTVQDTTWTIDNSSVATIGEKTGVVTPVNTGKATVTCTVLTKEGNTLTKTINVNVTIPLESMTINKPTSFNATNNSFDLYVGQTQTLTYTFNPTAYTGSKAVTLSSSDKSIVKIDESGNLVALKPGNVTITATSEATKDDGTHASDTINVVVPTVSIETLTINKSNTTIEKSENETLTATIASTDTEHQITDDQTITWKSSDEKIATVDSNGKITAVAPGDATITASVVSTSKGTLTDTCNVKVISTLTSLSLNEKSLVLEKGNKSSAITYTATPEDATVDSTGTSVRNSDGSLIKATFTSANESVATVDDTGIVTAVGVGTTTITVTVGNVSTTCQVEVNSKLTSIALSESKIELAKGADVTISVTNTPSDANVASDGTKLSSLTTAWTSSDVKVAIVDSNGKITAVAPGTATITATLDGKTDTVTVTVPEVNAAGVSISGIVNNQDVDRNVATTGKQQLAAVIYNDAGDVITNSTDTLKWEVTDEEGNATDVATIDQNGNITYNKAGTVIVSVSTYDVNGNQTANMDGIIVNVVEKNMEAITATIESNSVEEGNTTKVTYEVTPTDCTDDIKVEYTSDTPSVATIDEDGTVKALKAGETTITVKVTGTDGSGKTVEATAELALTVTPAPVISNTGSNGGSSNVGGGSGSSSVSEAVSALTKSPHTGDMNVEGLAIIMIISVVGMVICIKRKK